MAPTFRIHRPDVLASLPRPLDHTKGQYHIGEVYTQKAGSKKRKRLEVVVGVDGEAANIYHVPSSGLRTSYPIPPQESFTCAPHSIRYQDTVANGRNNYTYLSTQDSTGAKVTLCRDVVDATGKTISTSTSQKLQHKSPIRYLFTSTSVDTTDSDLKKSEKGDLIGLCKDGQVVCFGAEDLTQKWSASSYSLCRDLLPSTVAKYEVEYALHASASEVLNGIFQGRQDYFGSFGRQIDPKTYNPDVLTLVVRANTEDTTSRFLLVLGVVPAVSSQPLVQVHVTPLPSQDDLSSETSTYQLHVQSGKLLQLTGPLLQTYDLTSVVPRLQGRLPLVNNTSFLQLSEHSVLCLTATSASILNPTYQSVQAQTAVELPQGHEKQTPNLVTFLSKLDMAVAVVGNSLVSIQIERPKSHGKEGLLIDAIGRGLPRSDTVPASLPKPTGNNAFEQYLPGTLSSEYVEESLADVEKGDGYRQAQDWKAFEALLAQRFGVAIEQDENLDGVQTPEWKWLDRSEKYPAVDRRWVLYAITRVFTMDAQGSDASVLRYESPQANNVLLYLIYAGHLTTANMSAAFKAEMAEETAQSTIIDKLVERLVDQDPTMYLLLHYVSATKLGEKELLFIIRIIMRSLDQQSRLLLPAPKETKEEEYVEMEIDHLEKELELAEYHLGDDSNIRAQVLTTAFEKLASYSSIATVRALRATFNQAEILSLIHLLRVQLIGSAWTSRYVDATNFDRDEGSKAPPDGAISLIAELLSRCIDSVGPSGWLTNGTSGDQADAADFITALKLEVSAALEGLNEAGYLNGLVGEAVQYGRAATAGKAAAVRGQKPLSLDVEASSRLPLGLVSKQSVPHHKVVSGGEVTERTSRERGHLLSQKVKAYSLERIVI